MNEWMNGRFAPQQFNQNALTMSQRFVLWIFSIQFTHWTLWLVFTSTFASLSFACVVVVCYLFDSFNFYKTAKQNKTKKYCSVIINWLTVNSAICSYCFRSTTIFITFRFALQSWGCSSELVCNYQIKRKKARYSLADLYMVSLFGWKMYVFCLSYVFIGVH